MNTLMPNPQRNRDFTEADIDDFAEQTSEFPIDRNRKLVQEILERPELFGFIEQLVEVARLTREPARRLLDEWSQVETYILND